jgi:cobalt/nickel transport system permease protein
MIREPFSIDSSWIYRVNPKPKIIFATVYSSLIAISDSMSALMTALAFSILLAMVARLSLGNLARRLYAVLGFLLLIWLVLPWTFEGDPAFTAGPIVVTVQGLTLAAKITLKSMVILIVLTALLTTMTPATFGHTLGRLHVPDKIVYLLLITYRYIFVIEQEYLRLKRAAKVRGFQPRTDIHTYKTYAYLIGMLFVRSSNRAERVYHAMKCRGFKGKFYSLETFQTGWINWAFSLFMSAGCIFHTVLSGGIFT